MLHVSLRVIHLLLHETTIHNVSYVRYCDGRFCNICGDHTFANVGIDFCENALLSLCENSFGTHSCRVNAADLQRQEVNCTAEVLVAP
jgi:hypothetical protein